MTSFTFMVCPHDTSNTPDKWLYFAQYLSLHSPVRVHLEMSFDFDDFHDGFLNADLVYANPNDALNFVAHTGGRALAHPAGVYDEVVVVSPAKHPATTADLAGQEIVSVQKMMVTGIGLRALAKNNIQPLGIRNVNSWLEVVSALRQGSGRFGFIYKDTYDMLSPTNKEALYPICTSQEHILFHSLVASPRLASVADALQMVLTKMDQSAEGQIVLKDLGFDKWLPVHPMEWQMQQDVQAVGVG